MTNLGAVNSLYVNLAISGRRIDGRWRAASVTPHVTVEGHATLNGALVELFAKLRPILTLPTVKMCAKCKHPEDRHTLAVCNDCLCGVRHG